MWNEEKAIEWANKFKVSTQALAIALSESDLIDSTAYSTISDAKVPTHLKEDPELPAYLSTRSRDRKRTLLKHGLSNYYVSLCFEAYRQDFVSASRLIEMFLIESDHELIELADVYRERIRYVS